MKRYCLIAIVAALLGLSQDASAQRLKLLTLNVQDVMAEVQSIARSIKRGA